MKYSARPIFLRPMDTNKRPKLSIVIASYNTGKFLEPTLDSIFAQSFKDFEVIMLDSLSTDGTLEKMKKYPQVHLIAEKDKGAFDAFRKGYDLARGEYVMTCCVSDGYLDTDWFQKCLDVLDNEENISLVWGLPQYVNEQGKLGGVSFPQFYKAGAPQGEEFFYYWLASGFWLPEGNFCVRRRVIDECFPRFTQEAFDTLEPWLEFNYNFQSKGYMPRFLPVVASFGRLHEGSRGEQEAASGTGEMKFKLYISKIQKLRRSLLWGHGKQVYRDGNGDAVNIPFSRWHFWQSQIFSNKFSEHVRIFINHKAHHTIYFLEKRRMMPQFLKNIVEKQRRVKSGI